MVRFGGWSVLKKALVGRFSLMLTKFFSICTWNQQPWKIQPKWWEKTHCYFRHIERKPIFAPVLYDQISCIVPTCFEEIYQIGRESEWSYMTGHISENFPSCLLRGLIMAAAHPFARFSPRSLVFEGTAVQGVNRAWRSYGSWVNLDECWHVVFRCFRWHDGIGERCNKRLHDGDWQCCAPPLRLTVGQTQSIRLLNAFGEETRKLPTHPEITKKVGKKQGSNMPTAMSIAVYSAYIFSGECFALAV